ncbi:hypothetical protein RPHASCH2410_PC00345 (plasmid) [Rhizobium phaseoli Ch24-10]|nr:hypothetical protein RPHASCH2410_PC00345 [Rhizobium phaseoli Ch24-10]
MTVEAGFSITRSPVQRGGDPASQLSPNGQTQAFNLRRRSSSLSVAI